MKCRLNLGSCMRLVKARVYMFEPWVCTGHKDPKLAQPTLKP